MNEDSVHVTFRLLPKDIGSFEESTTPLAYKVVLFTLAGLTLAAVAFAAILKIRKSGLDSALTGPLRPLLIAVPFACVFLTWKRWRRGTEPGPEISVGLSPGGILVYQEGLSELRRSWPSIAEIKEDRGLIQFVPEVFDYGTGKQVRMRAAAIIVPVQSFPSREAVDAFLGAARRWHAAASS